MFQKTDLLTSAPHFLKGAVNIFKLNIEHFFEGTGNLYSAGLSIINSIGQEE